MTDDTAQIEIPSDSVLDEVPAKALKFFGAVASNLVIRASLARRGYTDEDHENAYSLVLKAAGFRKGLAPALARSDAAAAIAELDAWDEPNFRIARAALTAMPAQLAFLFDNLSPQTGTAAVASVATFLDRLDELESSNERKKSRKADLAAVEKLAKRGIHAAERKRLRGLLERATGSPDPKLFDVDPAAEEKTSTLKAEQRQAKIDLWLVLNEWTETAKAEISRRDYLITLGIAKRKAKKDAEKPQPS